MLAELGALGCSRMVIMRRKELIFCLVVSFGICWVLVPRVISWGEASSPRHGVGDLRFANLPQGDVRIIRLREQANRIRLNEAAPLPLHFVAPAGLEALLNRGLVSPTAIAAGDFDEDGETDLVCGYIGPGGGLLALVPGSHASWDERGGLTPGSDRKAGRDQPFELPAKVFVAPEAPDFILAGDFNADGHHDLAFARRGGMTLHYLFGDGRGGFHRREHVDLGGGVTIMAGGDINRADGLADVIVAVERERESALLIFEGPNGAARSLPEEISLPNSVTALGIEQFDGDYTIDLLVGAGQSLYMLKGRDRKISPPDSVSRSVPPPMMEALSFPARIMALAVGDFVPDRYYRSEIAVLDESGILHLVGEESYQLDAGERLSPRRMLLKEQWQSAIPVVPSPGAGSHLLTARLSGLRGEDLLVVSPADREIRIFSQPISGENEHAPMRRRASLDLVASLLLGEEVASIRSLRLNADAISDLVLLHRGETAPTLMMSTAAQTFTVTTTSDSGPGSLRQAILDANSTPGPDVIQFAIPGPQIPTIALRSPLPDIAEAVTIDGTTQPAGKVEINGAGAGLGINGLTVRGGDSVIRGLVINRFNVNFARLLSGDFLNSGGSAIVLASANNIVEGNFLGTDSAGRSALGNGLAGVVVTGPQNIIGGTTASARNVISGNLIAVGLATTAARQNRVQGNYLGTDVSGSTAVANSGGVVILGGVNNIVGGTTAAERNIISGNTKPLPVPTLSVSGGVAVGNLNSLQGATGNLIQGNFIGTTVTGMAALGNGGPGVFLGETQNNTVGGTSRGARNIIAANRGEGVQIYGSSARGNLVQGNVIGVAVDGTTPLGNGGAGILVTASASMTLIGGATDAAGNVIAFNGGGGVIVQSGIGNSILSNSIFANTGLGIDLGGDGVTPNDDRDLDGGPNTLQNFPTITAATYSDATATIRGSLNSTPGAGFRLEVFSNTACDASGFGQGQRLLTATSIATDGTGATNFFITISLASTARQFITATVTSSSGDTSEFSNCVELVRIRPVIAVAPDALDFGPVMVGQSKSLTLTVQNVGTAPLIVTGMASDSFVFTLSGILPPFTLSSQASQTITVRYTPPDRNEHSGRLAITSNDPERPTVMVTLTGRGARGPSIRTTPDSLDFGSVAVGEAIERALTIANEGDLALTVSGIDISASSFTVAAPSIPFTVNPGSNQDVILRFSPVSEGPQQAAARVSSDDPNRPSIIVTLTGSGERAVRRLAVSAMMLDFGTVMVGSFADRTLTLRNTGNATLTVEQVVTSDAQFAFQSPPLPLRLRPGSDAAAVIRFAPRNRGPQTAVLTIRSNDDAQPATDISLTGEGVFAPAFEASPLSLDFGMVALGQSVDRPLTIRNRTMTSVVINAVSDNPRFQVSSPAVPFTLAAGGEQVVLVRFTPIREGPDSGVITFTGDDAGMTRVDVAASGQGVRVRMLSVPDLDAVAGSVIALPVMLSDGTGVSALRFTIEFDPAILSVSNPQAITRGSAVPADFEFSVNTAIRGQVTILVLPPLQFPVPTLPGAGGVVALIPVQIATTVPDGSVTTVFFSAVSASDPDANPLSIQTQNGRVRITNVRPGDVNLDGKINEQDLIRLIRHLTGESPLTGNGLKAADVNCDGRVNEQDAIRLIQHLAGARPLPERCG